jgi:hypothetical protein
MYTSEVKTTNKTLEETTIVTMKKKECINLVKPKVNNFSINDSCYFANINKRYPVWWIDPNKEKLLGSWLLLNDKNNKKIYVFKMDNITLNKLTSKNKKQYRLEILIEKAPDCFIDKFSKIDLKKYYIQTINY